MDLLAPDGPARWCGTVPPMVIAMSKAVYYDIGLIGVFFVLFPVLVHGLLGYAGAGAYSEKRDNDHYLETHRIPGSDV